MCNLGEWNQGIRGSIRRKHLERREWQKRWEAVALLPRRMGCSTEERSRARPHTSTRQRKRMYMRLEPTNALCLWTPYSLEFEESSTGTWEDGTPRWLLFSLYCIALCRSLQHRQVGVRVPYSCGHFLRVSKVVLMITRKNPRRTALTLQSNNQLGIDQSIRAP